MNSKQYLDIDSEKDLSYCIHWIRLFMYCGCDDDDGSSVGSNCLIEIVKTPLRKIFSWRHV